MKKKTLTFIFALGLSLHGFGTTRADPFLDEMVGFEGEMFLAQHKVPALVIAVVRDGEVSVKGFGERAGPGSPPPDGDTLMRIGSIT
ncbi:MAG: D-alanyl-D-alanine-carboxypeptidase/endopeptidase AmpH, partial [Methyloceanibacter sp.]